MEVWKDVVGFDRYQVSNEGRVRSLKGRIKILKQSNHHQGYKHLNICQDGKQHKIKVHRLIAKAFLPNPTNLEQVNHKDGNKANNNVSNLEWCSRTDNNNHYWIELSCRRRGVHWHKKAQRWASSMMVNGKSKHLGYFDDKEEAYKCFYDSYLKEKGVAPWGSHEVP